jgi:hypothetical protein
MTKSAFVPSVPVVADATTVIAQTNEMKRQLEELGVSTLPTELLRRLEDLGFTTTPKLALLIRWSQAEQLANRGSYSPAMERLAWRGMEQLCHDVLRDVEELLRAADVQEGGFATLPDEEGGAR